MQEIVSHPFCIPAQKPHPWAYSNPRPGQITVFHFLASNGDTSISGNDVDGKALSFADGNYIDVYLNGVRLKHNEDYVTTTANTVSSIFWHKYIEVHAQYYAQPKGRIKFNKNKQPTKFQARNAYMVVVWRVRN